MIFHSLAHDVADILREVIAKAQRPADPLQIEGALVAILRDPKNVETRGDVAIEEVGLRKADSYLGLRAGDAHIGAQILAAAEQVALLNADVADRPRRRGKADA